MSDKHPFPFKSAWRENRTLTPLRELDFESNASTSSAIQAYDDLLCENVVKMYQELAGFSMG